MPEARAGALRVAIVGAESTGKSRLALALAHRLRDEFGLAAACVGEFLREWCDAEGRTPRADEQAAIAREQQRRIEAAGADVDVVVCDTTPVMTAIYSAMLFDDAALEDFARDCQRAVDLTLLTALDLPWIADGLQRDGPHVREPVDRALRDRLLAWDVSWALVQGTGESRTDSALAALRPLLQGRAEVTSGGLFSRLRESREGPPLRPWVCDRCDDPRCEHAAARGA